MPLPQKYRDALIESREKSERSARQETTRDLLRTCGHIVLWVLCGLALFGLAFHATDYAIGMIFWWAAHAVWIGGVSGALLAAYRRGERRGDW
jgi:hypothetical protein